MKKFICLQAGHQNVTTGATGAPGEQAFNIRIRDRVSAILLTKRNADKSEAFTLQLVDANPADSEINKDFNLFLAIHYDANIYGTGGGLVDYPDPAVDHVSAESKRIAEAISSIYFDHTGIVNHPERSNPKTKFYYMWARLTENTPCVLIECGVGLDPHDNVILNDTEQVAGAIARGICKAFDVPYDEVIPAQPPAGLPANCAKQNKLLYDLKTVAFGKGWVWTRLARVKTLLAEGGI